MTCEVSGPRRYSADLPQGDLEHPCRITFIGPSEKLSIDHMRDDVTFLATVNALLGSYFEWYRYDYELLQVL